MSIEAGAGDVILKIHPSQARRVISVGAMAAVALLLWGTAFGASEVGVVWPAILVTLGIGMLALARLFWLATSVSIELTSTELRISDGEVLAEVAEIERVDKSAFAFKPSNGLLVVMQQPGPRAWRPGLWWRIGTRLGIGGATSTGQAKALADALTLLLAERDEGRTARGADL